MSNSRTSVRIGPQGTVSFAERDDIFEQVATRKRSIDFTSALFYLPNPDPVLKKMGKDIEVYRDLLVDPQVLACVSRLKHGILSKEWDIDRGKAKSRIARMIRNAFAAIDNDDASGGLYRIIGELLDSILFGYQPSEIMWGNIDGYIMPVDIISKPQEWFNFDSDNTLLFRSIEDYAGTPVPEYKFICPTHHGSYVNPYGRAVLGSCFWPVTFKKGGLKFFIRFCEKYGMPWVVGKHNFSSREEIDKFVGELDAMVQDGIIAIGKDQQEVDVIPTGPSTSADIYEKLYSIMNDEIQLAILGHTASTRSTPGRLGGEDTAMQASDFMVSAGCKMIEQVMNVVIRWTYQLNGFTGDVPTFSLYEQEDVSSTIAVRDESLTRQGVVFTKEYYLRTYGFDDSDIEVGDTIQSTPPTNFAEQQRHEDQTLVDEIADLLTEPIASSKIGKAATKAVVDFIENTSSYEDALSSLAEVFSDMDVSYIENILVKAQAAAHAIGRTHAD